MIRKSALIKILAIGLLLILHQNTCFAQTHVCSFNSETVRNLEICLNTYSNIDKAIRFKKIVEEIGNHSGLPNLNFTVNSCNNINNAVAVHYDNKRQIIIDEKFIDALNKTQSSWFHLFILAHEMAHHIYGHTTIQTLSNAENRANELDCDRFAGLILKKRGAPISEITRILRSIPHPNTNNSTHPQLNERIKAATKGYNAAKENDAELLKKYRETIEREQKVHLYAVTSNEALNKTKDYWNLPSEESFKTAKQALLKAIALYPKNAQFYNDLADLFLMTGNKEMSIYYRNEAFEIDNSNSTLINLVATSVKTNRADIVDKYESQIKSIDYKAIKNVGLLTNLTLLYHHFGLYRESNKIADFGISITKNDEVKYTYSMLNFKALNHLRFAEFKEAEENINIGLHIIHELLSSKDPLGKSTLTYTDYLIMISNYALILMRLEKWNDCIGISNKILKELPECPAAHDGDIYYYLGRSYYGLMNYDKAIEMYNKSSEQNDGAFLYFFRGDAYMKKKNFNLDDLNNAYANFSRGCALGDEHSCRSLEALNRTKAENERNKK